MPAVKGILQNAGVGPRGSEQEVRLIALDFGRRAFGICASVALLAGCGQSQSSIDATGAMLQRGAIPMRPEHGGSWIEPAAKRSDLLYVTDQGTMDVYVFSYPQGTLEGTLTGFDEPSGLCTNKTGDVFVVNAFGQNIIEYAHGGTSPIATLSDPGEFPSGCSVDPTTGNLAVTNYCTGSSCAGAGSLSIYASASGSPKLYADLEISHFDFCGYDKNGNLFLDGTRKNGAFAFAELPAGKSKLRNITLNQSIVSPGNVQWDGTYVAVGDNKAGVVYQFTVSKNLGTKAGSTRLRGSKNIVQFWIESVTIIGPNSDAANVQFWNYPAGGRATKTITGLTRPIGATVSKG